MKSGSGRRVIPPGWKTGLSVSAGSEGLGGRGSPSCAEVAGKLQDGCNGRGAGDGGNFGGQRWTLGPHDLQGGMVAGGCICWEGCWGCRDNIG